jgi:hypothetical protein
MAFAPTVCFHVLLGSFISHGVATEMKKKLAAHLEAERVLAAKVSQVFQTIISRF